ncbi:MAG: ABC transporter ATP-binding protein [Planctomycetota bacterium]
MDAVKDLNLDIRAGEVFGLLGPNGSGKTTTIKMLLGLLYPTRGRVSVFGRAPTDVAVKARLGFLPEESYLYRFLVAEETLDYYGRLFRLPARIRKDRTERLLDMVGLRHEAKRRVGEFSKGMARRIGLAQALINDPEFLILDEPTSGLDPIGARQIKDVIRELGKKGKTILLSSHVLADVEDVCDRVTILYGGQQRATGDIAELLRRTDMTQITAPPLSSDTLEQVRQLISRLEKKDIIQVTHPRVKLEEFFLKIVEEAQVAKVRTSGARQGGAVPDFLQKPAEATREQVIEGLLAASAHGSSAVVRMEPPGFDHRPSPARELIDQLLGPSRAEPATPSPQPPAPGSPSAEPARQKQSADQSVIDSLLGQSADQREDAGP